MARRLLMVLVLGLALVALMAAQAGCGGKPNPEETVKAFWDAVSRGDLEGAKSYFSSTVDPNTVIRFFPASEASAEQFIKFITARMKLVTTGHTISGNNATVDATLTMPDISMLRAQLMPKIMEMLSSKPGDTKPSIEDILKELMPMIAKVYNEAPLKDEKIQISLAWEEKSWKISADPFVDIKKQLQGI